MKVKILKTVKSGQSWRREGDVIELSGKELTHYLNKGIAVEHKEVKAPKQTKEEKKVAKRVTKSKK